MTARILLVEDNYVSRQMLSDYLIYSGYQVLDLIEGSSFFQALADFQPNLVLLDLKLPDINGYTLLEQIQQSKWQHIPVVVVSAFAFIADEQHARSLGATEYLVKPVDFNVLQKVIREVLDLYNKVS